MGVLLLQSESVPSKIITQFSLLFNEASRLSICAPRNRSAAGLKTTDDDNSPLGRVSQWTAFRLVVNDNQTYFLSRFDRHFLKKGKTRRETILSEPLTNTNQNHAYGYRCSM